MVLLGGGREHHSLICGQWPHSGSQHHLSPVDTGGGGKYFLEGGTVDEPW